MRELDGRLSRILLADDTLLAFGGYGSEELGASVYSLEGELRFRLFAGEEVWDVQAAGPYAYVLIGDRVAIVDLRSGRVISDGLTSYGQLLTGEERPWY